MSEVQRAASAALLSVLRGHSLTATLHALWAEHPALSAAQRGAIQDLAFGACRWLGTLRAALAALVHRPPSDPEVEALLLVALFQLQWTRAPHYSVVDGAVRTCAALGKTSAKGLVNGVLRNFLRTREAVLAGARAGEVGRFSYPQWWIDLVRCAWPQDYVHILETGNTRPPMTLRVNRRRIELHAYLDMLHAAGSAATVIGPDALRLEIPVPVQALPGFTDGLVSIQDLGAQYAALALDLADGQRVLDACAAPGGKTAHVLELADVDLLALDRDPDRIRRVEETLQRLRLRAAVRLADAGALETWWDGRPFDRVLLDAPCTASGVVRRHPDSKWLRRPDDVAALAQEQARLLAALWHTLGAGGKLLYVTCSVFPAETQEQIDRFLAAQPDAQRLALPAAFPEAAGQLLPDERHDGFFYALLHKRAPAPDVGCA